MTIYRISPKGLEFHITERPDGKCLIELLPRAATLKSIMVAAKLEDLSQSWYNWQMRGQAIQQAFHYLSSEEREFILTGLTPDEWKKIFSEDDN